MGLRCIYLTKIRYAGTDVTSLYEAKADVDLAIIDGGACIRWHAPGTLLRGIPDRHFKVWVNRKGRSVELAPQQRQRPQNRLGRTVSPAAHRPTL